MSLSLGLKACVCHSTIEDGKAVSVCNAVIGHHALHRVLDGNAQAHRTVAANNAAASEYPSICMTNQSSMSAGLVKLYCSRLTA